jgi:hypothetical protein
MAIAANSSRLRVFVFFNTVQGEGSLRRKKCVTAKK